MSPQEKFTLTRQELSKSLIERDDDIAITMTALLTGDPCLFVGPPGTGKSLLADSICSWIDGNRFSILLNRFTTPEEVFGPVSITGLKSDEYRRITDGMLPEAHVALLDEIWKASTAILNTMLKILNERKFKNGKSEVPCPLQLCIAASNEYPTEAKELGALFDRFLYRKNVAPVGIEANVDRLVFEDDLTPSLSTTLSLAELNQARVDMRAVTWSDDAKEAFHAIRRQITREGVLVGDRRIRKSNAACKAFAWLSGNNEVTTDDLEILSHLWWVSPESQPALVADTVAEIAQPSGLIATQLLADANQLVRNCNHENEEDLVVTCKKLAQMVKKLKGATAPRTVQVRERVAEMVRQLRLSTIENL